MEYCKSNEDKWDYEVWIACDVSGGVIKPMSANVAIDTVNNLTTMLPQSDGVVRSKRAVVLYPKET
jgi:hypothetical protein